MAKLESILQFIEDTFQVSTFPDYPNAWNGLQVAAPSDVTSVGAAVDASEATLNEGAGRGLDLLLVHHGLFWGGLGPITGPFHRKLATLFRGGMGLYSLHLPLDAHPTLGNCALLARRLGFEPEGRFGTFKGTEIGCWADVPPMTREDLTHLVAERLSENARLIPGGRETVSRVGVLTGSGSDAIDEAASAGLDTLITGEAPHHAYHQAMEMGINLILGGHYATETMGVQALAASLSREFDIPWEFLDFPTGL